MSVHLIDPLVSRVRNFLLMDSGDIGGTVILAGTGRSGTTWVENIINVNNDYRVMFEPFYAGKLDLLGKWKYRQYLRAGDRREEFLLPAKTILSGKVKNEWIDRYNTRWIAKRRLVKDIRTMLILKWIRSNFPEIPIILLMRHPCAVAVSKLKLGWKTHLDEFLSQPELIDDYLAPYERCLREPMSVFERHIMLWCVENYVPLCQFDEGEVLVIFYEDLCSKPGFEVERINAYIKANIADDYQAVFARPSALSRKDSAINTGESLIDNWRKSVDSAEIKRASKICEMFGLDRIYSEENMPLVRADRVLGLFGDPKANERTADT